MADVKLFLSCVSDEFGDYRDELRKGLTLPNVAVKIQEDFMRRAVTPCACCKSISSSARRSSISPATWMARPPSRAAWSTF
jgi:hypothetical protein